MSDQISTGSTVSAGDDKRGGDRRMTDRRRQDRRSPPPVWRRPSAYIAYGVAGALIVIGLVRITTGEADDPPIAGVVDEPVVESGGRLPAMSGAERTAFSAAEFEELIAEGERSVGQVVRTELYCGSITPILVREIEGVNPALTALSDAEGRVAAAECRWSRDARSDDLLLVVPPALAERFAGAPTEEMSFVMRRRIPARVVWLGRSEALALRYAAVLREIVE